MLDSTFSRVLRGMRFISAHNLFIRFVFLSFLLSVFHEKVHDTRKQRSDEIFAAPFRSKLETIHPCPNFARDLFADASPGRTVAFGFVMPGSTNREFRSNAETTVCERRCCFFVIMRRRPEVQSAPTRPTPSDASAERPGPGPRAAGATADAVRAPIRAAPRRTETSTFAKHTQTGADANRGPVHRRKTDGCDDATMRPEESSSSESSSSASARTRPLPSPVNPHDDRSERVVERSSIITTKRRASTSRRRRFTRPDRARALVARVPARPVIIRHIHPSSFIRRVRASSLNPRRAILAVSLFTPRHSRPCPLRSRRLPRVRPLPRPPRRVCGTRDTETPPRPCREVARSRNSKTETRTRTV